MGGWEISIYSTWYRNINFFLAHQLSYIDDIGTVVVLYWWELFWRTWSWFTSELVHWTRTSTSTGGVLWSNKACNLKCRFTSFIPKFHKHLTSVIIWPVLSFPYFDHLYEYPFCCTAYNKKLERSNDVALGQKLKYIGKYDMYNIYIYKDVCVYT